MHNFISADIFFSLSVGCMQLKLTWRHLFINNINVRYEMKSLWELMALGIKCLGCWQAQGKQHSGDSSHYGSVMINHLTQNSIRKMEGESCSLGNNTPELNDWRAGPKLSFHSFSVKIEEAKWVVSLRTSG